MKKILFVDDEENIRRSLRRELEFWFEEKNLSFVGAASVDEGLAILEAGHQDFVAVVSDLKMPIKKGTVLLKAVSERWPLISTILLTGYSDIDEIKEAIKSGILAFIQKPWDGTFLRLELERAMNLTMVKTENQHYLQRLERDFTWSRTMHHHFLLNSRLDPSFGSLDLGWLPARGTVDCGGDFFITVPKGGSFYLVFASLSVQGVEGTYHALRVREAIGILAEDMVAKQGPERLMEAINDHLVNNYPDLPGGCMNLAVFLLDPHNPRVSYSIAGGEQFALVHKSGVEVHALPSPALGYKKGIIFPPRTLTLQEDSFLLCMSRSLMERHDLRDRVPSVLNSGLARGVNAQGLLKDLIPPGGIPEDATILCYKRP